MQNKEKNKSRRAFVKKLTLGSALITSNFGIIAKAEGKATFNISRAHGSEKYTLNDQINLAIIGAGIQGIYDTRVALGVDGVKLVAACDLYEGRLERAKELFGKDIFTTRDYRQVLDRNDIDAVIIACPDHWHKKISIEAMKAGKAVYCEKPMVKSFDEGHEVIAAQKETGMVYQVGSQGMASLGNEKARQLYEEGAIGELVMLDMYNDRYSAEGAWQYPIPPDATKKTIDFDTFLGQAPKVPYDPTRFFRWRNYQDYGTGVAGDLFVHAFSTLHYVIGSDGPVRALSTGGLRYWKDGRDVPDVTLTLYDYEKTQNHSAFNAVFRVNFVAGSGGGGAFRLIGTEGEMHVGDGKVSVKRSKMGTGPGQYSLIAYTEETQKEIRKRFAKSHTENRTALLDLGETVFEAPRDYKGGHHDHFYNFFQAARGKKQVIQDATYGHRAAGAALLANESYFNNKIARWNPQSMKLL